MKTVKDVDTIGEVYNYHYKSLDCLADGSSCKSYIKEHTLDKDIKSAINLAYH